MSNQLSLIFSAEGQRVSWIMCGAAAVLVAVWTIGFVWRRVLLPVSMRTRTKLDTILLSRAELPVKAVALATGLRIIFLWGIEGTAWLQSFPARIMDGLLYSGMVVSVSLLGYALILAASDWYMAEISVRTTTTLDDKLIPIIRRLIKVVIFFIALTVIFGHFEVKITALLGAAGVASLAVALAAQETVANMISGLSILLDRPFRIGDRIQLADGTMGDVHEIGLRSTKILTFDGSLLILPNKEISDARIVNLSYPDPKYTIRRDFTVAYGSDVAKVKRVLLEIAAAHPLMLKEPAPGVYFTEFGESALNFKLICHVGDYKVAFKTVDEINTEVNRRFTEEGIEIPFPQRDIHIRNGGLTAGQFALKIE